MAARGADGVDALFSARILSLYPPIGPIKDDSGEVLGSTLLLLDAGRVDFFDAEDVCLWEASFDTDPGDSLSWEVVDPAGNQIGTVGADHVLYVHGMQVGRFRDGRRWGEIHVFDASGTTAVADINEQRRHDGVAVQFLDPMTPDDFRRLVITLAYANWWWTD